MVIQQLAKSALEHKLAWREERIVFDDVSLGEAVAQVNRYSQTALKIVDPALMDLHVSGAFSTADVPVFIRSLEQGFGLQVAQTAEGYRISQASQR
jgi:transmembrane sensor